MSTPEQHHPDGALSDPLHDWWEKNGRGLIIGALILVIGTGVVFGFRAYRNSQEQTIQVEFNDAVVADELAAYAQENSGYPLGGVAAIQTANQAFAEEDWDRAIEFYSTAAGALKGNPLEGKARLGIAISQAEKGNAEEARKVLSAVANDTALFPASRAEAIYFLALLSLESGDQSAFADLTAQLDEVDQVGLWKGKLDYYQNRVAIPVTEEAADDSENTVEPTAPTAPAAALVPAQLPAPEEAASIVSVEAAPEAVEETTTEVLEETPSETIEAEVETTTEPQAPVEPTTAAAESAQDSAE